MLRIEKPARLKGDERILIMNILPTTLCITPYLNRGLFITTIERIAEAQKIALEMPGKDIF